MIKPLVTLVAILLVIAGWLALKTEFRHEARLVIENRSLEQITTLKVKVCNQEFKLGSLAPGQKKEVKITEYSDSDWQISGKWPDGTTISEQQGYITHGMRFDDRAVFEQDRELTFSSNPR
jgi:hypothetical protein